MYGMAHTEDNHTLDCLDPRPQIFELFRSRNLNTQPLVVEGHIIPHQKPLISNFFMKNYPHISFKFK